MQPEHVRVGQQQARQRGRERQADPLPELDPEHIADAPAEGLENAQFAPFGGVEPTCPVEDQQQKGQPGQQRPEHQQPTPVAEQRPVGVAQLRPRHDAHPGKLTINFAAQVADLVGVAHPHADVGDIAGRNAQHVPGGRVGQHNQVAGEQV